MSKKPKLEDIPGVGPKTAESLKEAGFKTVKSLSKADPAKLMDKVEGIGETTAAQIIKEAKKMVPEEKPKPKKEPKKAKPKKKEPKAEPKTIQEAKPEKVDLTDIPGVGPKTADSLREAGFKTVKSLAKADPAKLEDKVDGIGDALASQIVEEAAKLVPEKPVKKPKKVEKKKPKKKAKELDLPTKGLQVDKRLLRIAQAKRRRQPKFRHEQAHRWKRVSDSWRKVRGIDSATREKRRGRIAMVSAGYRKPKSVRGLHPSLYQEVLVQRPADLEQLDPEIHAIRIGGTVGMRKRQDIIRKADAMLLRVLNPGVPEVLDEEELFDELDDLEVD